MRTSTSLRPALASLAVILGVVATLVVLRHNPDRADALPTDTIPPFTADLQIVADGDTLTGELIYLGPDRWRMTRSDGYQQVWQDGVLYVTDTELDYTRAYEELDRAVPGPWFVTPSTAKGRGAVDGPGGQYVDEQDRQRIVYRFDDLRTIPLGYQVSEEGRTIYEVKLSNLDSPEEPDATFPIPDVDVWPDKAPSAPTSPAKNSGT